MPNEIENYVHRIGRTGRCGKTGIATTFINKASSETVLLDLKHLLIEAKQRVPPVLHALEDPLDNIQVGRAALAARQPERISCNKRCLSLSLSGGRRWPATLRVARAAHTAAGWGTASTTVQSWTRRTRWRWPTSEAMPLGREGTEQRCRGEGAQCTCVYTYYICTFFFFSLFTHPPTHSSMDKKQGNYYAELS